MEKKDSTDDLDKESRRRLEKLADTWDESVSSLKKENLTLADLRLLLEHFTPLQDLIRGIVAVPEGASPAAWAQQATAMRKQIDELEAGRRSAEADCACLKSELSQAQARCHALQKDLAECTATTQQLLKANGKLEKQLQQALKERDACRAELDRSGSVPEELAQLRSDAVLAQRLDLGDLPDDDTRALIQVVAVLAQRDNLERLWQALKERCETQNRQASQAELGLLKAALAWHNHNWRTRPYRLIEAAPRTPYDFDRHQRSLQTTGGEKVSEQRLPGIADGSGKALCKALVGTA